jgi:uncharacterized oxidoreductase
MNMRDNTIFITGGGSGIGRGLAESFHRLGNKVIVAGRREEALKSVCAANPGMRYNLLDINDAAAIRSLASRVIAESPELNCVINNAGIQRVHDFTADGAVDDRAIVAEIQTNLLGLIRVCDAFLPHLRRQPRATLVNVSSGLAFVPMSIIPVYCATKAAVHSFTVSLRHQLKGSSVSVIELVPPYVATDLNRAAGPRRPSGSGGSAMPLDQFITEAMKELSTATEEAAVGFAKSTLAASWGEAARTIFNRLNP